MTNSEDPNDMSHNVLILSGSVLLAKLNNLYGLNLTWGAYIMYIDS